jgi:hypothetical protein
MCLWVEALAGVDMGLTLGDMNVCASLQRSLLDWSEGSGSLASAWRATYGTVPPLIHEVLNVRGRKMSESELALVLARTRVTFLALSRDERSREQVRAAALERAICEYPEYRQKGYVRTHAKLCESEVLSSEVASGVAYCMHASDADAAAAPPCVLEIATDLLPGDADHLDLAQVYLGVDLEGGCVLLDAFRGASPVKVANRLPHDWCVRVSGHTNVFLVGDSTCALLLSLNEGRSSAMDVPVSLPRYPTSGAYDVENKWVVWRDGSSGKARAFEWEEEGAGRRGARMCSSEEASLHGSSRVVLRAEGNRVFVGSTCIAHLPAAESITVVVGHAFGFDAFTQGGDW